MSHRILWPVVACLGLGGLTLVLSQSTAQRPGGGGLGGPPGMQGGMPGGSPGMPGRFVVANASSSQVLVLDTATGQVYRAKEADFKKMSDLPGMGQPGGGNARPPARDRRPDPNDDAPPPARDRRPPGKDKDDVRPPAREDRPAPKEGPGPQRKDRE